MENSVHSVELTSDSRLAAILGGTTFEVNSAHHQAIQTTGDGLRTVGYAPDGVNEAIEHTIHPFASACSGTQRQW